MAGGRQNGDDVALILPRDMAARLATQGPGRGAGSPLEVMRGWPAGTGRASPGMSGEPVSSHQPGGDLENQLLHPSITIQEQLFNVLPDPGWFSPNVSPTSPQQFEIGTFVVPKAQSYWLMDYEFQIFVQSGIDPNDTLPAANGRFFGIMGFDLTFTGRRLAAIRYELDGHPVVVGPQFGGGGGGGGAFPPPSAFSTARFNQFAQATAAGLSLLPAWRKLMGPRQGPFSLIAQEGDRVTLSCAIFRPVPAPVTGITARVAGFQLAKMASSAIIDRLRPR